MTCTIEETHATTRYDLVLTDLTAEQLASLWVLCGTVVGSSPIQSIGRDIYDAIDSEYDDTDIYDLADSLRAKHDPSLNIK